jgi:hypothetical protein
VGGAGRDALETAAGLLRGAVDLHIHTAPDVYPRSVTAVEAAEQARDAGMRAIAVKSHSTDTAARAELAASLTGFAVVGGVALNYPVGGFNPHAVAETARQGGRIVWLPTTSARHFLAGAASAPAIAAEAPLDQPGLVATERGAVLPEVEAVLEQVAEHGLVLCSGHLAPDEALAVFARARELGVRKLVATHPHADFVGATIEQMRAFADLGALNEMTYSLSTPVMASPQPVAAIARAIRAVGPDRCFLATDGGQAVNPPPAEMLRDWLAALLEEGFGEAELRPMVSETPLALIAGAA